MSASALRALRALIVTADTAAQTSSYKFTETMLHQPIRLAFMVHYGIGWLYGYASYYLFGSGSSGLGSEEMGILDKVGEIAGAVAAVEALEQVDPDAGLLPKAAAAVAASKVRARWNHLSKRRATMSRRQQMTRNPPAPRILRRNSV
jgi:hypothetical protein